MTEKTIHSREIFEGRVLRVRVLDVELDGGRRSTREVVVHPGAAVILPQLPDGRFVFVRQFRKAIEQDLLETVAGTLSPGEDPDACARRELREETGYEADELCKLGVIFPAPGYSSEALHVYYARLKPEYVGQAPDDDEKLDVVYARAADIARMIRDGALRDAKTLAAWQLYQAWATETA